jgi:hypothetical protein
MTRISAVRAVLPLFLVLLSLPALVQPSDDPLVCLAGVPSWGSGNEDPIPTEGSFAALQALAGFLQADGVPLTHLTDRRAPLEAMAAVVNLNAAALFVGVRSSGDGPQCVAAHAPQTPTWVKKTPVGQSSEELREAMRRAHATERATLSQRLAAHIAAAVPNCHRPPDKWIEYFLTASRGPTVVVELRPFPPSDKQQSEPSDRGTLLGAVAGAIGQYLAEPPHNKWMHQTKRLD